MCYGCPFIWIINSIQGSLLELDQGLGAVIVIWMVLKRFIIPLIHAFYQAICSRPYNFAHKKVLTLCASEVFFFLTLTTIAHIHQV
jgi:hypothetical protein